MAPVTDNKQHQFNITAYTPNELASIKRLFNTLKHCDYMLLPRFQETAIIILGSCLDNMAVDRTASLWSAK